MPKKQLSKDTLRAIHRYGRTVEDIARPYGISGEALLAKLVAGESGDNPGAVSYAGAKGRTQFMPGSRDIALRKYGVDPWRSADEAVHAAALHLRGKINGSKGLEGYNPGDPNYPRYILDQQVGDVGGSGGGRRASTGTPGTPETVVTPGVDNSLLRKQLVRSFLAEGGVANPNAVLSLAGSYSQAADIPGSVETVTTPGSAKRSPSSRGSGTVPLGGSKNAGKGAFTVSGPNPDRLQKPLSSFARKVADIYGGSLVGLDGSTHSKYTVNGNVSEHYTGNATDIFTIDGKPATGARLIRAGRAALIAAGMPRAKALKAPGGLYNVGGHQIIFGVDGKQYGGNHLDHLHISARK